jgi:hypothetical protein
LAGLVNQKAEFVAGLTRLNLTVVKKAKEIA